MERPIKVLVVRFSSIGDIVLTSPVVRCLKTQINAEVHFLTKQAFLPLVEHNPYIYKVWILEENCSGLISKLKKESFDYFIDLHKNIRSFRLAFSLGVSRLTYHKATFEKLMMVYFKINILPKTHVAERYLKAVKPLSIVNDGQGLDFFFPDKWQGSPKTAIDRPYICAVIGATHFTKRLPVENWIKFIQNTDQNVILIGGKTEEQAAFEISTHTGANVRNMVGKLTLLESAFMLNHADKVISNDTGMLHIAAALKKPLVSIWGGTLWQYGFWPYYPEGMDLNKSLEIKNLSCRPCSKFGRDDCPKKHFRCMKEIEIKL
ncbi:MAG: glycosyltransferase family 9 protein [Saprospiraceae bacterium]|nr:glycosyltransferase family 9 protein [Saprospiraceae bacterium]